MILPLRTVVSFCLLPFSIFEFDILQLWRTAKCSVKDKTVLGKWEDYRQQFLGCRRLITFWKSAMRLTLFNFFKDKRNKQRFFKTSILGIWKIHDSERLIIIMCWYTWSFINQKPQLFLKSFVLFYYNWWHFLVLRFKIGRIICKWLKY